MILNLDPREEAWLDAEAALQGLPADKIVKRLIDAQLLCNSHYLNPLAENRVSDSNRALFAQWAEEDATPGLSAKSLETIAYLDERIEEGRNATPEERRLADLEVEELRRNLNANRAITGERQI